MSSKLEKMTNIRMVDTSGMNTVVENREIREENYESICYLHFRKKNKKSKAQTRVY